MPVGTLLDRLRYLASQKDYFASRATCAEAANEIERLYAELRLISNSRIAEHCRRIARRALGLTRNQEADESR